MRFMVADIVLPRTSSGWMKAQSCSEKKELTMSRLKLRTISLGICLAVMGGLVAYPLGVRSALAGDHNPRIHHALEALHAAEEELNEAPHDFHGHKADAIDAIHHAIRELDRIKDW
jgi:hypothetical protein